MIKVKNQKKTVADVALIVLLFLLFIVFYLVKHFNYNFYLTWGQTEQAYT